MTPWAAWSAATASAYGPSAPRSGTSSGTNDGDLAAELAGRRGHLGADEPATDDRHGLAGLHCLVQVRAQRNASSMVRSRCTPGSPTPGRSRRAAAPVAIDDRIGVDGGGVGEQHRGPARRIRPQGGGVTPRCQVTSRSSVSPSSDSSTWAWLAPRKSLDNGGRS